MKLSGVKKHGDRLKRLVSPEQERKIAQALFKFGQMIEVTAEHLITAGSVSGKGHVPSKPGEPPNRDTGVLDNNIETTFGEGLTVLVSSNAPYAAALELGSEREAGVTSRTFAGHTTNYGPSKAKQGPIKIEFGDSSMEARPYMRPALKMKRAEGLAYVRKVISKTLEGE